MTNKLYSKFYKQNKFLVTIYSLSFLFLVVDLTSLLLTLSQRGVFKKQAESSSTFVLAIPIIIEWLITLGFYVNFQIRKKKLKKKVKQIIDDKRNRFKFYNKERLAKIAKILKLQGRHFKNTYFENLLITILLFLIPIIIKNTILRKVGFKAIFSVSAILFYGYDIMLNLIKFIIRLSKQRKYNKELYRKKDGNTYSSLDNGDNSKNVQENNIQDNNNVSMEDIDVVINDNALYERNSKMKSILSEKYLNISFLLVKSFMGILFIFYFMRIGEKLDDKTNSTTWVILFIPCYIFFLPVLLYCIFHILALYSVFQEKIWIPIITIFPCLFVFIANCIIIPLKLDNKINFHEVLITIFFVIGTIFLLIHLYVLHKFKK